MESESSEDKWKKKLTKEQYGVLREKGTEPAFTGKYWNHHEKGIYKCAGCGAPLFSSEKITHVIKQFLKGSYSPYLILAVAGSVIVWRKKEFQITHWMLLSAVVFTFIIFYPVPILKGVKLQYIHIY